MSDHDDAGGKSSFSAPIPELDDHRHNNATVYRPRRGTFDSLYGSRQDRSGDEHQPFARDFESVIVDEEDAQAPPAPRRRPTFESRRLTFESTMSTRAASPPNSVKAFAEARKQQGLSSDTKPDRQAGDVDLPRLARAASVLSRRSYLSRPLTIDAADEAASLASLATNKTVEEDVCFPVQDERRGDSLHIDFEYLESFIRAEREIRQAARNNPAVREFPDLRPGGNKMPMFTLSGDILDVPSDADVKADQQTSEQKPRSQTAQPANFDPGRVSFFSSAWESTIHAADLDGLVLPGEDIRGLFTFPKGETDGVWWLNVHKPLEEEIRAICRAFGVHPLTIEDITTQEAREKIELFPSYYFACFKSFNVGVDNETQETEYVPFNMYVIVFREGTLSFTYAHNPHASHVRKRITMLKDYVALSSDWICYALIDDIVDGFAPAISKLERDSDQIEDEVFLARTDDMAQFLRKIMTARKNVMGLMRLLGGKADVLRGFTKRCNENYTVTPRMDIGLYLGDIQDHVVTMVTNLGHFEKMLSRAHSNYLAQLSIDSITQGTSTNKVLSKITLLASIIVPLNVVTGLFGMNVHVPWQDTDNLNAFLTILAGLVGFCIITLFLARWYRLV